VNRHLRKAVLALSVGGLVLGGAGAMHRDVARADTTTANKPAPSFNLKVGDVMSFTGDLSAYGPSLDAAVKIGVDQINKALAADGLSDRLSVTLVGSEDDQTKIPPAVEGAQKLVKVDKANVLIGTISSGSTIAVAQSVAIPNNIVQITPTSSTPAISFLKDKNLVFRLLPSDSFSAVELVKAVSLRLGKRATVNLGFRNDDFGNALAALFKTKWKANGGQLGKVVSWNPDAPNFDTEAQQLAGGDPDGWVIIDFPQTFQKFAPALVRAGGWTPTKTFMTNEMKDSDALKKIGSEATEGLSGVATTFPKTSASKQLSALFKKQAKGKPETGFEGVSFDAVTLSFLAALEARTSNPSVFKNHIQKVTGPPGVKLNFTQLPKAIKLIIAGKKVNFEGVSGPLDLDSHGDPTSETFEVWKVKDSVPQTQATYKIVAGKE
jgi:ABC-type branched-subunit amino acid transport system substrate-binding protein